MDCLMVKERMDDFMDEQMDSRTRQGFFDHFNTCQSCRNHYLEEMRLRKALKALPVPPPDPSFGDRVFRQVAERRKGHGQNFVEWMRIAAVILLVFGAGYWFRETRQAAMPGMPAVTISKGQPQEIRLVFNSREALDNVTFSLEIPQGVTLDGFGSERKIVWVGSLAKGSNLLVLPVTAQSMTGGSLVASLRHGEHSRQFGVSLKIVNSVYNDSRAVRPKRYEMSIRSI